MSQESHFSHFGGILNLLRQVAAVGHGTSQMLAAAAETPVNTEIDGDLLYQLPSVSSEMDTTASVVPVTVMFIDLRGFTALVEEYPPNQVICQLNEYFSSMTRIIVEQGGILDKYMGDEIMAYFECQTPLDYPKAANKAVYAGICMIQALEKLNARWRHRGLPMLKSGIGINSGPVLKGNIGSMIKLETTIIGDTVNVASRLQHLNKDYDARLLISASTYQLIQGKIPIRFLGQLPIRGRRQPVEVYEIILPKGIAEDNPMTLDVTLSSASSGQDYTFNTAKP